MNARPEDPFLEAWKSQYESAMRVIEAISEGSQKLREAQLRAAMHAHETASEMRRRVSAAEDARELCAMQGEWLATNIGAALGYWREVLEIAMQTQSTIAGCLAAPAMRPAARASRERHHALIASRTRTTVEAADRQRSQSEAPSGTVAKAR